MHDHLDDTTEFLRFFLIDQLESVRLSRHFVQELKCGRKARALDVWKVSDELRAMDGRCKTPTRPAEPFLHAPLKGFMKKHYFQTSFMAKNLAGYWRANSPKSTKLHDFARMMEKRFPDRRQFAARIAHGMTIDAFLKRVEEGLTGEWIIYSNRAGQKTVLGLAKHSEGDQIIFDRLRTQCGEEYPDLFPLNEQTIWYDGCLIRA